MRYSLHIGNAWHPKHGMATTICILLGVCALVALTLISAFHVFAQDIAAPAAPVMVSVAPSGIDATSVVLQILPLFLSTLAPYMTQGVKALVKTASTSMNSKVWGAVTLILGTAIASVTAALGDTSVVNAMAGGAAISGVSWNLKQGAPVAIEGPKKEA